MELLDNFAFNYTCANIFGAVLTTTIKSSTSLENNLGSRRVVDITANFVALDDGSKIFLTP